MTAVRRAASGTARPRGRHAMRRELRDARGPRPVPPRPPGGPRGRTGTRRTAKNLANLAGISGGCLGDRATATAAALGHPCKAVAALLDTPTPTTASLRSPEAATRIGGGLAQLTPTYPSGRVADPTPTLGRASVGDSGALPEAHADGTASAPARRRSSGIRHARTGVSDLRRHRVAASAAGGVHRVTRQAVVARRVQQQRLRVAEHAPQFKIAAPPARAARSR